MIAHFLDSWRMFVHLWYYVWPLFLIVGILVVTFFIAKKLQGY